MGDAGPGTRPSSFPLGSSATAHGSGTDAANGKTSGGRCAAFGGPPPAARARVVRPRLLSAAKVAAMQ